MNCNCGSNRAYGTCCMPLIEGHHQAQTAESLMRSRYTAFTLANIDYLMKTHHVSTRPIKDKLEILNWAKSVQWMELTILNTQKGKAHDKDGIVEFKALYLENGTLQAIHEKSLFRNEKGIWYYVSGQHY
ncbi:hypothetical protein KEM09_15035 [Carboxylicivirga mesophila]|uniref:YchJ-like middle NTF2-like domain-containing protein n=1 Tax=Carboxylicivirga mesophila TaxID=1166478 RepID=A0ABS5KD25_9BACT|nr:YchJ family metal-binding protein [Carboxylicivirga mesophila]MBS2212732.1 hypothetical protein [Carboxylicivirga mesophila]